MLSLGGDIGTCLWVGTGTALKAAGPVGIAVAHSLVALAIYIGFISLERWLAINP
jgi:amino acid transporter